MSSYTFWHSKWHKIAPINSNAPIETLSHAAMRAPFKT